MPGSTLRLLPVSVTESVHDARWRLVLIAYIKGQCIYHLDIFYLTTVHASGAATTASRLGQPDLAIATLNDFVQVTECLVLTAR
jgi:hypothetical protein